MAPRARQRKNIGLPPFLYTWDGNFYYRDRNTGKTYPLGKDRASAITQAIEANKHFDNVNVSLLDKITGNAERTVSDFCNLLEELNKAPARIKYVKEGLGTYIIAKLTPLQITEWLDKKWKDKLRMRQAMLGTIKGILSEAKGKGWVDVNVATDLLTDAPKTARERLSLEEYLLIHTHAEVPLKRAMELALMAPARRGNVTQLKWSDIKDGYLHIEHIKVDGMKIRYPLSLYLPDVKWTLGDVIGRCKDGVLSRYLIHHNSNHGMAKAGDPWRDKSIEQMFRDAREKAGLTVPEGKTPPTFHEIRSLARRLWSGHGVDMKALLGHKTTKSSDLYDDPRGKEWVTVIKK